jgi:enterochelin esterase-like enzyme
VGVIFSGAGAVLGVALGRVLAVPIVTLASFVIARIGLLVKRQAVSPRRLLSALPALTLSAVIIGALVLTGSNLDSILNYGTTANIYQPAHPPVLRGMVQPGIYPSPALGGAKRKFMLYLPPSYFRAPQRRYPVMYMLHGDPGTITNWFRGAHVDATSDILLTAGKMRETIFVAPDGSGPTYRVSEWANSLDGRQRMEDSVVDDLVHYVDTHYRTIADSADRVIAGISDGGFAAANIALHHPDVFGAVLTLGGYFVADASNPVFGTGTASATYRHDNSPALYVATPSGLEAARSLRFIIGVGVQDREFYQAGVAFYAQLQQFGVHTDLLEAHGGHSWQIWSMQAAQALPMLEPPLSAPSAQFPACCGA